MRPDKIDALMELKKLLDARIIDDNEFAEQKKKILSDEQPTRGIKHKLVWIVLGVIIVGIIVIVSQYRNKSQSYQREDEYYTPEEVIDVDTAYATYEDYTSEEVMVEEVIADSVTEVVSPYGY